MTLTKRRCDIVAPRRVKSLQSNGGAIWKTPTSKPRKKRRCTPSPLLKPRRAIAPRSGCYCLTVRCGGGGVKLTQAECRILHEIVQGVRAQREVGRPGKSSDSENYDLASYCVLLELDGMAHKPAVADTVRVFGRARSTVYTAYKRYGPRIRKRFEALTPAQRQELRELQEANALAESK
jgi:hypothetical protein